MSELQWKPNVTVAAMIESEGRFLLVEEQTPQGLRLNQPAGHLEAGESLLAAVRREAREESGYCFEPDSLLGIYRLESTVKGVTFLRFAYCGRAVAPIEPVTLDEEIVRVLWLSAEEVRASVARHRSTLVLRCVEDWLTGDRHPLALIHDE